jgi:hypothetical protein
MEINELLLMLAGFDPSQPREANGRFGSGSRLSPAEKGLLIKHAHEGHEGAQAALKAHAKGMHGVARQGIAAIKGASPEKVPVALGGKLGATQSHKDLIAETHAKIGLTDKEKGALEAFTGNGYQYIRGAQITKDNKKSADKSALAGVSQDPAMKKQATEWAGHIEGAIARKEATLGAFKGTLHRGVLVSKEEASKFVEGHTFNHASLTSWTSQEKTATRYGTPKKGVEGQHGVVMHLPNPQATMPAGIMHLEGEHVMGSGGSFSVAKVEDIGGVKHVHLEQTGHTPYAPPAAKPARNGSRANGTNPRAMGTNPRALGTNPRALEAKAQDFVSKAHADSEFEAFHESAQAQMDAHLAGKKAALDKAEKQYSAHVEKHQGHGKSTAVSKRQQQLSSAASDAKDEYESAKRAHKEEYDDKAFSRRLFNEKKMEEAKEAASSKEKVGRMYSMKAAKMLSIMSPEDPRVALLLAGYQHDQPRSVDGKWTDNPTAAPLGPQEKGNLLKHAHGDGEHSAQAQLALKAHSKGMHAEARWINQRLPKFEAPQKQKASQGTAHLDEKFKAAYDAHETLASAQRDGNGRYGVEKGMEKQLSKLKVGGKKHEELSGQLKEHVAKSSEIDGKIRDAMKVSSEKTSEYHKAFESHHELHPDEAVAHFEKHFQGKTIGHAVLTVPRDTVENARHSKEELEQAKAVHAGTSRGYAAQARSKLDAIAESRGLDVAMHTIHEAHSYGSVTNKWGNEQSPIVYKNGHGEAVFKGPYHENMISDAKEIGAKWDPMDKEWRVKGEKAFESMKSATDKHFGQVVESYHHKEGLESGPTAKQILDVHSKHGSKSTHGDVVDLIRQSNKAHEDFSRPKSELATFISNGFVKPSGETTNHATGEKTIHAPPSMFTPSSMFRDAYKKAKSQ